MTDEREFMELSNSDMKKRSLVRQKLAKLECLMSEQELPDNHNDVRQVKEISRRFGKVKYGIKGLTEPEIDILNRIWKKYKK